MFCSSTLKRNLQIVIFPGDKSRARRAVPLHPIVPMVAVGTPVLTQSVKRISSRGDRGNQVKNNAPAASSRGIDKNYSHPVVSPVPGE